MQTKRSQENYIMPSKGMIMLKATVFAMGIVLVVMLLVFLLIKNKSHKNIVGNVVVECSKAKTILLDREIEKIEIQNGVVVLLTKLNTNLQTQQIVRIDAACGHELNRINLKIKK